MTWLACRTQTGWCRRAAGRAARLLVCAAVIVACLVLVAPVGAAVPSFGGWSWSQISGTDTALRAVAFANTDDGWAVGDGGAVLATTNGGATWGKQTSGTTAILSALAFCGASDGWAVGAKGAVCATTNGGATWKEQRSSSTEGLTGVAFTSASKGWAVRRRRHDLRHDQRRRHLESAAVGHDLRPHGHRSDRPR